MELLNDLRTDERFLPFVKPVCEDEGICVEMDETIKEEEFIIIKVDDYYNAQRLEKTPASVDCFIVQHCKDNHYDIYLIELKNVKSPKLIERPNLREKFGNTLYDFLNTKCKQYFHNEKYSFNIRLWLSAGKVKDSTIRHLNLEFLLSLRPIKFMDKSYPIMSSKPQPRIEKCK